MSKRFFAVVFTLLTIAASIFSFNAQPTTIPFPQANAWEYNDGTPSDSLSEAFGPRVDRLLIKLYSSSNIMWNALENGEIDVTDYELNNVPYERFKTPPLNNTVNVIDCGSDGSFNILDINNNNNEFLGNPPDPSSPNPVYPNPCSVLGVRKAVAYLCDRNYITNNITGPLGHPLYTPLLPEAGSFVHPDIRLGGAREDLCYLYSRSMANSCLDSSGFAEKDVEGWRIWNVTGQRVELRFLIYTTPTNRKAFSEFLADELEAVGIKVIRVYLIFSPGFDHPKYHKNFHLFVGGWSLDTCPNSLILWNWNYYWHPGGCYNYAGCNDPTFNAASEAVEYADTPEDAIAPAHLAQVRFAEMVLSVPLWSISIQQAVSRRYVGTPATPDAEDMWEGQYWEGLTPEDTLGSFGGWSGADNCLTFMNMHTVNEAKGDGSHMTIRYGFSVSSLISLNPIKAEWLWDIKTLDLLYEGLLKRDPYDLNSFIPWLAAAYEMGTYNNPTLGECTKVKITMRPDVFWSDGTPLTAADVLFSLVEMGDILDARGLNPIWCPWVDWISGFKILDAYNFEILMNAKDVWIAGYLCTAWILPRHVWEPLCRTADPSHLFGFSPDPNLIASGPWRLKEYTAPSHVELVRNSPGSTVQTNLPGSTSITSTHGYFKANPLDVTIYRDCHRGKFEIMRYGPPVKINFTATLMNLHYGDDLIVDKYLYVDNVLQPSYPIADLSLSPSTPHEEQFSYTWTKGKHIIKVAAYIKEPSPWAGIWVNTTICIWVTLKQDVTGSTYYDDIGFPAYPYKHRLRTPDFKVDLKDVYEIYKAYGSYPGHPNWDPLFDMNGDYKIDLKDVYSISSNYGWA